MGNNVFADIVRPYFKRLDELFGSLAREAITNQVNAETIVSDYLSDTARRDRFRSRSLPIISEEIKNFWSANGMKVLRRVRHLGGLKGRFGGDIGPHVFEPIWSQAGLYLDTTLVPDPLLRVANMPQEIGWRKDHYLLKYGIMQVLSQQVYLADVSPPIAVLVPDTRLPGDPKLQRILSPSSDLDLVAFTNKVWGATLDDFDSALEFFNGFGSITELLSAAVFPSALTFSESASPDPESQWQDCMDRASQDGFTSAFGDEGLSEQLMLGLMIHCRFQQINDVLWQSQMYNAHPLIQAPVSFHWLKWKFKVNHELLSDQLELPSEMPFTMTNALLAEQLQWLSNVPTDALVALRAKGQLSETRSIISDAFNSATSVSLDDLPSIAAHIDLKLCEALRAHQQEIRELDRSMRAEVTCEIPTFLLGVTAAFLPSFAGISPELIQSIGAVTGTTSLKDIVQSIVKHVRERRRLSNSPVGILWNAKHKSVSA